MVSLAPFTKFYWYIRQPEEFVYRRKLWHQYGLLCVPYDKSLQVSFVEITSYEISSGTTGDIDLRLQAKSGVRV